MRYGEKNMIQEKTKKRIFESARPIVQNTIVMSLRNGLQIILVIASIYLLICKNYFSMKQMIRQ